MRRPVKLLCGLLVSALDGPIRPIADVYFHDGLWLVRGVAVNRCTPARRVVIPVSWLQRFRFGPSGIRLGIALHDLASLPRIAETTARSARNLAGYSVEARDGPAGRVADLVVDDAGWWAPGLVVATRSLLPGGEHEVPTSTVAGIDSLNRRVHLRITRAQIVHRPAPRDASVYLNVAE